MSLRTCVCLVSLLLCPALGYAQDFGVAESAETIDRGNFKLRANPILIFQDGDSEPGVGFAAGYGVTDSFDFEGKLALYDGVTLFGGDVEFWLVKDPRPIDFSISAGFHYAKSDFSDSTGVDVTLIGSHALTPRLDFYAALDMAFNKFRDDFPDNSFTQVHLVPGIEYKIHQDLDFVAEFGISLTDEGNHYLSGGLAYYLR